MAEDKAESTGARIQRRNAELGQILSKARSMEDKSKTQCGDHLGITRQRYAQMEEGEVTIGAAELEELVRYLRIPAYLVWPAELDDSGGKEQLMYIQAVEGESVHIIVGPYDAENVPESFTHKFTARLRKTRKGMWTREYPDKK